MQIGLYSLLELCKHSILLLFLYGSHFQLYCFYFFGSTIICLLTRYLSRYIFVVVTHSFAPKSSPAQTLYNTRFVTHAPLFYHSCGYFLDWKDDHVFTISFKYGSTNDVKVRFKSSCTCRTPTPYSQ